MVALAAKAPAPTTHFMNLAACMVRQLQGACRRSGARNFNLCSAVTKVSSTLRFRCPLHLSGLPLSAPAALSAKGYGIHGTPDPEAVSKHSSHGCIRLTNWDALELGKHVSK
jgi:hypothetical protein